MPYLVVLLAFPLVYYLTVTLVRYRFPMDPILTILAAYGVSQVLALTRFDMLSDRGAKLA